MSMRSGRYEPIAIDEVPLTPLRSVVPGDQGMYTCVARNVVGRWVILADPQSRGASSILPSQDLCHGLPTYLAI